MNEYTDGFFKDIHEIITPDRWDNNASYDSWENDSFLIIKKETHFLESSKTFVTSGPLYVP